MNARSHRKWPWYGTAGLLLMVVFWYLNWNLEGVRTHWAFFPLWFGFILFVNGMSYLFSGNSLISRSWSHFAFLFILSAPFWWIFEFINAHVQYWVYIPANWLTRWEYISFASLNFSVVLPGIFSLAELFSIFFSKTNRPFWKIGNNHKMVLFIFVLGWGLLAVTLLYPDFSMAFLWMSLFFILDPINLWLGHPSILKCTSRGDWRVIWLLWLASLACGLAWELWNYHSYPKWLYTIPHVDFIYIFEMPVLGYLGYLPFSMELFALYSLVMGLMGSRNLISEALNQNFS